MRRTRSRRGQCWPRNHRLRKRREYLLLQRKAKRQITADLVVLWMPGRAGLTRLGITVSRKVAKQAVVRNRVKRWVREAFRGLDLEAEKKPLDLVVIARPGAQHAGFAAIQRQLTTVWTELTQPKETPP